MKTEFEYKGMQKSILLEQQANEEISKIIQKYEWVNHAIVHFTKDKGEKGCVCAIEVRSGAAPDVFVKDGNGKFEVSIAKAFDVLDRQLSKAKGKLFHS